MGIHLWYQPAAWTDVYKSRGAVYAADAANTPDAVYAPNAVYATDAVYAPGAAYPPDAESSRPHMASSEVECSRAGVLQEPTFSRPVGHESAFN